MHNTSPADFPTHAINVNQQAQRHFYMALVLCFITLTAGTLAWNISYRPNAGDIQIPPQMLIAIHVMIVLILGQIATGIMTLWLEKEQTRMMSLRLTAATGTIHLLPLALIATLPAFLQNVPDAGIMGGRDMTLQLTALISVMGGAIIAGVAIMIETAIENASEHRSAGIQENEHAAT